ncbi:MAG: DUF1207 domain-containing protein [Pirellulaceae bacterium]|nr:DUF1207 domain-containing protein [Pirellulaceae bacterium]
MARLRCAPNDRLTRQPGPWLPTGLLAACCAGLMLAVPTAGAQQPMPPGTVYFDADQQQLVPAQPVYVVQQSVVDEPAWGLRILPRGLIYRPYLAGPKESRTGVQFFHEDELGWSYDSTVGGQFGLLRIGTDDPYFPLGIQLDVEASAQFRQRNLLVLDILTSDIRLGIPLSFTHGPHKTKVGVYFLRSHADDDLIFQLPELDFDEFFERQSLVLGHSIYLTNQFRIYGEVGYAFHTRVADPWEVQFGAEFAPVMPTGLLGSPFLAANAYLRQEVDFGGTLTLQGGWSWRGRDARLLRVGVHYANGMSNQFVLHDKHEQQLGFGVWLDF